MYFVLQKGALHRKYEQLSADKTKKGLELVDPKFALMPGPGAYSPKATDGIAFNKKSNSISLNENKKKSLVMGSTLFMSNLKTSGLNLTTVPSIPSKSQLLVVHP